MVIVCQSDLQWKTDMDRNTGFWTLRIAASVGVLATLVFAGAAHASVTISSDTTQNMSCANGVCAPTGKDAVLNVGDLENLLATESVEVTTTGSGVQADNIVVHAALAWSTSSAFSLDAQRSIEIERPVSVQALSALTLTTNGGSTRGRGTLSFGAKGNVAFANLSSSLTINGSEYTLVSTVKGLASAVANNPSGEYALAASYDAKQDGTYTSPPVSTTFTGALEGLGNTFENLTVDGDSEDGAALFYRVHLGGVLADIGLTNVQIESSFATAALANYNDGTVAGAYATGKVGGEKGGYAGGLIASNHGTIRDSWSSAATRGLMAGGLAAGNTGNIINCFSTGTTVGKRYVIAGGLVGSNSGSIANSYAMGSVSGGDGSEIGGLIGENEGTIATSYSTGKVSGRINFTGGFIGDNAAGSTSDSYWDTTTSGTGLGVGQGSSAGITGLTTQQLQSGLPEGFQRSVWGERATINGGFPYLKANPPPG